MQARIKTQNDIIIVHLNGRVDVETAPPFRAACSREFKGRKVIFDFSSLSFVGSQGILPFLETLQSFYEQAPANMKFSGVGLEFRKIFSATPLSVVEIHDNAEMALHAFMRPVQIMPVAVQPVALQTDDFIAYRSEPVPEKKPSDSLEPDDELDV